MLSRFSSRHSPVVCGKEAGTGNTCDSDQKWGGGGGGGGAWGGVGGLGWGDGRRVVAGWRVLAFLLCTNG